jgi:hypothetical protein
VVHVYNPTLRQEFKASLGSTVRPCLRERDGERKRERERGEREGKKVFVFPKIIDIYCRSTVKR